MSETVTSPAGEEIEVVEESSRAVIWDSTGPVVAALWVEGMIESANGRVGTLLYERARRYGYGATRAGLNHLLKPETVLGGLLDREIDAKRTYRVRLARLPGSWLERLPDPAESALATASTDLVVSANGDGPEVEEPSVLVDVSATQMVAGIVASARTDGLVPIRLYPMMRDLERNVDEVLVELARLTRRERR